MTDRAKRPACETCRHFRRVRGIAGQCMNVDAPAGGRVVLWTKRPVWACHSSWTPDQVRGDEQGVEHGERH